MFYGGFLMFYGIFLLFYGIGIVSCSFEVRGKGDQRADFPEVVWGLPKSLKATAHSSTYLPRLLQEVKGL